MPTEAHGFWRCVGTGTAQGTDSRRPKGDLLEGRIGPRGPARSRSAPTCKRGTFAGIEASADIRVSSSRSPPTSRDVVGGDSLSGPRESSLSRGCASHDTARQVRERGVRETTTSASAIAV